MRSLKWMLALGWLLIWVTSVSATQDYTSRLNAVLEQIKSHLAEQRPEWKHRSIFRKGDVIVWISTSITNLKEAVKINQEFARLIEAAIITV